MRRECANLRRNVFPSADETKCSLHDACSLDFRLLGATPLPSGDGHSERELGTRWDAGEFELIASNNGWAGDDEKFRRQARIGFRTQGERFGPRLYIRNRIKADYLGRALRIFHEAHSNRLLTPLVLNWNT